MIGGATVLAVGPRDGYVTPKFARAGDHLIITKGPAIEASGILATLFPDRLESRYGKEFSDNAQHLFYKMSVVEEALAAVSVGVRDRGVTAMHDATECGIWGGVYELAEAAGLGARLDKDAVVMEPGVPEICELFGIQDPFAAISEGTLILSCKPHASGAILETLKKKGIPASIAGELTKPEHGITVVWQGRESPFRHPRVDPFWNAFYEALKNKP